MEAVYIVVYRIYDFILQGAAECRKIGIIAYLDDYFLFFYAFRDSKDQTTLLRRPQDNIKPSPSSNLVPSTRKRRRTWCYKLGTYYCGDKQSIEEILFFAAQHSGSKSDK